MQIKRINLAFWRYCLRPLHSYPFFKCSNEGELRELTRQTLSNNVELSQWVDKLLDRSKGYHAELIIQKENSTVNRQLYYASKILISTVLKNDTGLRGGITPVVLSPPLDNQNKKCKFDDISIPSSVKYNKVNDEGFNVNSLIDYRITPDDYIIPFDDSINRLNLSDDKITIIDTISRNIIHNFTRKNKNLISADCFPFAIDFFIRQDKDIILPFESHFPGRGLGVHFLPFLLFSQKRKNFQNYFNELFFEIKKQYGYTAKFEIGNCGQTSFHGLDRSFVELINNNFSLLNSNNSQQNIKRIDLDVNDDYKSFPDRTISEWDYSLNQIIIDKNITWDDASRIKKKLGNWVIVKSSVPRSAV